MDKERKKINLQNRYRYPAGDFRSRECIELLKEADIVVTNPPFSLFKDLLLYLVKYKKKFLIIGRSNFYGFKDVFPLLKDNRVWTGRSPRQSTWFRMPKDYDISGIAKMRTDEKGNRFIQISGIRWFTNLKTGYKQKPLDMREVYYTPEKYPKYDNYDAINVDKVADIPCDYPGVMGVPLTFMDKYCPEQFEIVGLAGKDGFGLKSYKKYDDYYEIRPDGKPTGASGKKTNGNPVLAGKTNKSNYFLDALGKTVRSLYSRIFIKSKHPENSKQNAGLKPA